MNICGAHVGVEEHVDPRLHGADGAAALGAGMRPVRAREEARGGARVATWLSEPSIRTRTVGVSRGRLRRAKSGGMMTRDARRAARGASCSASLGRSRIAR